MEKKRILYVSQEITPYLPESPMSNVARHLPQAIQERGKEIRNFMPRYGVVNERRHQLHEVIRLSGMNLIIDDNDHPLIIKVASIQPARMQVYFIDNEEYFKRKAVFNDKETKEFFVDNDERSVFFCRGVIETVKKLGWSPDVIHCQGWMASLLPVYMKKVYNNDPMFENTKIVTSVYNNPFKGKLNERLSEKAVFDNLTPADFDTIKEPTYQNLIKLAIDHSDAVIYGEEKVDSDIKNHIDTTGVKTLEYQGEDYVEVYDSFYDEILEDAGVLVD